MNQQQAQDLVINEVGKDWAVGAFYIDAAFESNEGFFFLYGAEEFLVQEDDRFMTLDTPVAYVSKRSGRLALISKSDFRELKPRMI